MVRGMKITPKNRLGYHKKQIQSLGGPMVISRIFLKKLCYPGMISGGHIRGGWPRLAFVSCLVIIQAKK